MAKYKVEVFEKYVGFYEVEAETMKDAVKEYMQGRGTVTDKSVFVCTDDSKGMDGIRAITTPDGETIHWSQLECDDEK